MAHIIGEVPSTVFDAGCMCGYFKHFLDVNCAYKPTYYLGVDRWPEAIEVAREFLPNDWFMEADFLSTPFSGRYDYVCVNNINFGSDLDQVIRKAFGLAKKSVLLGMPKHCPDATGLARELGFIAEHFDCGQSVVTRIEVKQNGPDNVCGVTDSS
jgi:SAM-dependent methyltransferase